MAITVLDQELVVARLVSQVSGVKKWGYAGNLAAAQKTGLKQVPSGWVIPIRDTPSPNDLMTQAVRQRTVNTFGVVYAVRNLRDAIAGKNSLDDLKGLRIAAMTALIGWQPDVSFDPIIYAGGAMLQMLDSVVWWQDSFSTAFYLRS